MRRSRRGGNAIEFGLLAPLFFALMLGGIDYGLFMTQYQAAVHAVREGARAASVADLDNGEDPLVLGETAADSILNIVWLSGSDCVYTQTFRPSIVTCTYDQPFTAWVGFMQIGDFMPARITRSHSMVVEQSWPGVNIENDTGNP